ncbi:MAG: TetR/AcrR family transcriptional regulator [Fibrobacter sp.]|jgi:TetR/AcrR family transcriptional repressor of nem operon|nr:TetR/AcrR family transcriptional regulator [Fibrobacter sp.]
MKKSEKTREFILEKCAPVFNQKGYTGTSLSDLENATGLTKGCIYGLFRNKEELAVACFDYARSLIHERMDSEAKKKDNAIEKLRAIFDMYRTFPEFWPVKGGCPILNTSIEADDTNPELQERVVKALEIWRRYFASIITRGIRNGEIQPNANPHVIATLFIALLEGATMMSKAYNDSSSLGIVLDKIDEMIEQLRVKK